MSVQPTIEKIDTDVLIIGSGGSGLRAAIAATEQGARVLVIAKEFLKDAHTGWAMGGINVAIKAPATAEMHFEDTIKGGWYINNYRLARIFAEEMPARIHDLEGYGDQ
jgi:succinate dehydrogenase / fumarate reductase flavoprotein subunit